MTAARLATTIARLSLLILAGARVSLAAPCCGGNPALPALITGDDRAQVGLSVGRGEVIGDAPAVGIPVFRADGDVEQTETLRIDAAYRLSDDWQAAIGVPLVRRSRAVAAAAGDTGTGLGDLSADVAYEFWPELTYSAWRPHGLLFAVATLPTGASIYDASDALLLDARGRGFFSLGTGVAFLKAWGGLDASLVADVHRAFSRAASLADGLHVELSPGWGAGATASAGYRPGLGAWRVGLSLGPVYEGSIGVSGELTSRSASQLVWNASAQLSYLFEREFSAALVYADQTLLGPASNVALSRALSLVMQKRWEL